MEEECSPEVVMDIAETVVRWVGAVLVAVLLAAVMLGLWQGRRRARGRGVGPGQRIAALPFWLYLVMTIGYLGLCYLLWRPIPLSPSISARAILLVAGALLLFPGLAVVLWARLTLGRSYGVSGTLGTQLYADHQLVTGGPFAFVRHPMYVGLLVAALGGVLVYRTWTPVFIALNFVGFVFRARREEQALAAEFGEEWTAYCRRVPAWVPRLREDRQEKDKS
jgi:protein-S-isoprenylcysteine O-methyltransferase Ste14